MTERRVLVICAGNTCRGPTLMLLLRHRARQLGLGPGVCIESAGLTTGAAKSRPMLSTARAATAHAAMWLDQQARAGTDRALLALLAEEAAGHRSRQVTLLRGEQPFAKVVYLDKPGRLAPACSVLDWLQLVELHDHYMPDKAYNTYCRHGKRENHPAVKKAYQEQALRLASLVLDELDGLLRSP
jgi:hypothetical protein